MGYEEFRKRKAASRVTTLPSSSSSKSKKAKDGKLKESKPVKIQVGIKEFDEHDGTLKVLKGRTLPITVNPIINAAGLLMAAITKHAKHFRTFNSDANYVLLYPDNTIVNNLPGSSEAF